MNSETERVISFGETFEIVDHRFTHVRRLLHRLVSTLRRDSARSTTSSGCHSRVRRLTLERLLAEIDRKDHGNHRQRNHRGDRPQIGIGKRIGL
jgi:hypothetical protein